MPGDPLGSTQRNRLLQLSIAVKPGVREDAMKKLEGPEPPESLQYLAEILEDVHGRSGVGMSSLAPLTFDTLIKYQAASGATLSWLEMKALMYLDTVMLSASAPASEPVKAAPTMDEATRGKR